MSIQPPTARLVALVVAAVVSLATVGPAFAEPVGGGGCSAMAGAGGCPRGSAVSSCCCADARPAIPADHQTPAGGAPAFGSAPDAAGWFAVAVLVPACAVLVPTHGFRSVPLQTLLSTFLI